LTHWVFPSTHPADESLAASEVLPVLFPLAIPEVLPLALTPVLLPLTVPELAPLPVPEALPLAAPVLAPTIAPDSPFVPELLAPPLLAPLPVLPPLDMPVPPRLAPAPELPQAVAKMVIPTNPASFMTALPNLSLEILSRLPRDWPSPPPSFSA
jgi:hypothetical protein